MRTLALIGAIASLILSGCATYQLGEPTELPYQSVSIAPPRNFSTLPQIEGPLNAALRHSLQRSGALSLASGSSADAILEITVLEARREIAAVSPQDVGRGRKFELIIDLELNLKQSAASEIFFIEGRKFSVKQDIFSDSGQVDAEYQAIPEISRQIAERATELLVDLW
ncbi:hypothetical protein VDG1235_4107 [Verrucomicrobiia bacterium DG1235]|nr:hypothetical protein VDG1235_4107 [Verrucomicrobiae bacterium DG1235]